MTDRTPAPDPHDRTRDPDPGNVRPSDAEVRRRERRAGRVQLVGSLLVAAAIAGGTVAAVTAKLGTTSVAALEAEEERAKRVEDAREERRDAADERAEDRADRATERRKDREDAAEDARGD